MPSTGNQIAEHSSDNETVLGSSGKLGGVTKHLIGGGGECICRLSFEFWGLHVIKRHSKGCFTKFLFDLLFLLELSNT